MWLVGVAGVKGMPNSGLLLEAPAGHLVDRGFIYDTGGEDTLSLEYDEADQRVDLRPEGISDVAGLTGNLSIARGTVIEDFFAGTGNDTVTGNDAANYISGNSGNDTLAGGSGDDQLYGGSGTDVLDGGPGDDYLDGGFGNDTLRGGAGEDYLQGWYGSDTFVFGDGDTVRDFEDLSDMIDISAFGHINRDNFEAHVTIRGEAGPYIRDVEIQIGDAVLTLATESADDITVADFILSP